MKERSKSKERRIKEEADGKEIRRQSHKRRRGENEMRGDGRE